jgi:hypothetical protein
MRRPVGVRACGPAGRVVVALATALAVLGAGASAFAAPLGGPSGSDRGESARRQGATAPLLAIASVSPWVSPDGEFQVRFSPTTSVPGDAQLTVTIHQSLESSSEESVRTQVERIIDGASPGPFLRAPITTAFDALGDPRTGATLTIPVRATRQDSDRVLLPNPGIHPVELVLTSGDGPELWSQTVFLNRLPVDETDTDEEDGDAGGADAEDGPAPVRVSLVLPVESTPAVGTDGASAFDVAEQGQLAAAASLLESVPDAPLTLAVRPNTLDGLARSTQPWASSLLEVLSDDVEQGVVVQRPYVDVDTAALVASDRPGEVDRQVLIGAATVRERLGRSTDASTWTLDDSVSTQSLPVLARTGVTSLLMPVESLRLPPDVDEQDAITSPLELEGGDGIRVLGYDSAVSLRLADTGVDPSVRAHQSVALMLAGWFTAAEERDPPALASAVLVSPTVDPEVLESLQATLTADGPLAAAPRAGTLPARGTDEPGTTPMASLAPRATSDVRGTVDQVDEIRRLVAAYRSMTGEADPQTPLWDELSDQAMAATLDPAERSEMLATVRGGIGNQVDQIEPPRERRVVVTSEDTVIPLRFRNDLPFDVTLVMRVRSPRLDIEEPTSEIVLEPGENRVDVAVTVQAPGESLLRIALSSPDGGITVPGPDVPVRSTAISGVGAALSIVSVLFLLAWWFRTLRRGRRERARTNGSHPSAADPSSDEDGATGPEPAGDGAAAGAPTRPPPTDKLVGGG